MSVIWNNELSVKVIELYRACECLWAPYNTTYKCRNAKAEAWKKIAESVGLESTEVKRKMKNLIAQFYRERRRSSFKKCGAGTVYISKWFAYNYLLFLCDKNKIRKCTEGCINETEVSHCNTYLL